MNSPARMRRPRDAASTERAILDAAEALFSRRGLDSVTTKEIAAAADVSMGSLYHHFPSKDTVYAAVVKRAFGGKAVLPPELYDGRRSARKRLELLVAWYIRALVDNETFRGLLNREVLDPRSDMPHLLDREIFGEPLTVFQSLLREIAPKADVELAVVSTFALIFGLTNLRSLTGSYPAIGRLSTPEQVAAHATRLVLKGLA